MRQYNIRENEMKEGTQGYDALFLGFKKVREDSTGIFDVRVYCFALDN